jgi:lipopolysaccharide transport system ATP-binding protein
MGTITISNLGKAYKQYENRWARLGEWILPFNKTFHTLKWVIKDVSFKVNEGEAIGIIGINGAGKSTLLKMITGTTQPTTGSVVVTGRVAALLELGMGFHPDFTGRQNLYMAGQLIGYTQKDISELMTSIESFAEIGDYIDMPVRVYSSGMQMRLAFSIATATRPDVLIVDEALSVGDAYFQHKSFSRLRDYQKQGTTLLLVSHDKQAIQSICDRAILLSNGTLLLEGRPDVVMDYYNAMLSPENAKNVKQEQLDNGNIRISSGSGEATVTDIKIVDDEGHSLEVIAVGQRVRICVEVLVKKDLPRLVLGYGIKNRLGQVMYGTNTSLKECPLVEVKASAKYRFEFEFNMLLGMGDYSVQTALTSTSTHLVDNYEWRDLALLFNVININTTHFEGGVWMDPIIRTIELDA